MPSGETRRATQVAQNRAPQPAAPAKPAKRKRSPNALARGMTPQPSSDKLYSTPDSPYGAAPPIASEAANNVAAPKTRTRNALRDMMGGGEKRDVYAAGGVTDRELGVQADGGASDENNANRGEAGGE